MNKPIFIHTVCTGDFNRITYSDKKLKCTRREMRTQVFFQPRPDLTKAEEMEMKGDLERGRRFSTGREGFLFGARQSLLKHGSFFNVVK